MSAGIRDVSLDEVVRLNTSEVAPESGEVMAVSEPDALAEMIRRTRGADRRSIMVAGELSNTVVSRRIEGKLVLFRDGRVTGIEAGDGDGVLMEVEASCNLDDAVRMSCAEGIAGIEMLSGIPGTVGAAVVQNVAAYGQSIAGAFVSARAIDLATGELLELGPADLHFGYRQSSLKVAGSFSPRLVLLGVRLALSRGEPQPLHYEDLARWHREHGRCEEDTRARRESVVELRTAKGMVVGADGWVPCSGSYFIGPTVAPDRAQAIARKVRGQEFADRFLEWYRPDGEAVRLPAAIALRAAGFMNGDRWGTVGLGTRHILALCNLGGATGDDLVTVGIHVNREVRRRLDIELSPEVRVLGVPAVAGWDEFVARNPFSPGSGEPEWALSIGGHHAGTN